MKRYLMAFAILGLAEYLTLVLVFRNDARPWSAVSPYFLFTLTITPVWMWSLLRLWKHLRNAWLRLGTCLLGTWLSMVAVVVLVFLLTPDPFAAERIVEEGWLLYLLLDKVARGIIFGVFFATIAYIWVWLPMGALFYALLRLALGGAQASAARSTEPPNA